MIGGRIKCDFCSFIGEMVPGMSNTVKIPDSWITITPMITVHGMRGLKFDDPKKEALDKIKDKVKLKVETIHCCPGCASERDVFDLGLCLPSPPPREAQENYIRRDQ